MKYSLQQLESLPSLCVAQADDLKIDTGTTRIWLSRCGTEDGEPYDNKVTVEQLIDGVWETTEEYEAQ